MLDHDPQPGTSSPPGTPIFATRNLPCPHCGYNTRGLEKPLCPECGLTFDPAEALRLLEMLARPRLSLPWLAWNMLRRPMTFWLLPQRQSRRGPSPVRIATIVGMITCFCLGMILDQSIWRYWVGRRAATNTPIILVADIGWAIVLLVIDLLHKMLIQGRLPQDRPIPAARLTWSVVSYARLWTIPSSILLFITMRVLMPVAWPPASVSKGLHNLWRQPWGLASLAALLACCTLWSLTLYAGGRQPPLGSRRLGLWCAITNPFWYVAAILFTMAAVT